MKNRQFFKYLKDRGTVDKLSDMNFTVQKLLYSFCRFFFLKNVYVFSKIFQKAFLRL